MLLVGAGADMEEGAGAVSYVLYFHSEVSRHLEGLCSFSTNWIQAMGITTDTCPLFPFSTGVCLHIWIQARGVVYNPKVLEKRTLPRMGPAL